MQAADPAGLMQAADPAEALEAAFNAELADFFVALREGKSSHMLQHLSALRAMSSADALYSIATTASAIMSAALGPIM